jgi:hypothetical protein
MALILMIQMLANQEHLACLKYCQCFLFGYLYESIFFDRNTQVDYFGLFIVDLAE